MLGRSILRLRSAIGLVIFSSMISSPVVLKADLIAKLKANFKANASPMKAINAALVGGNFDTVITHATTIADWARVMANYIPENSDSAIPRNAPIFGWILTDLRAAHPPMNKRL